MGVGRDEGEDKERNLRVSGSLEGIRVEEERRAEGGKGRSGKIEGGSRGDEGRVGEGGDRGSAAIVCEIERLKENINTVESYKRKREERVTKIRREEQERKKRGGGGEEGGREGGGKGGGRRETR